MKTLIVATDFSKEAENSLEYAGELAQRIQAKVVLFNSFSLPVHASNSLLSAASFQELLNHNKAILKARALKLSETYSVQVEIETGFMDLARELDELIAKHDDVILIMGMAPKSVEQDIFGNSTTSMIMKLKYPVLAIPYSSKFEGINKILFACDEIENKALLNKVRDFALALGAEIEFFHVGKRIEEMSGDEKRLSTTLVIEEVLNDVTHYYKNVASDEVVKEIEKEIVRINADLVIMVPQKYGFLESLIHRSKTHIMASSNSVPLLSLPML
jgi:nucleotide-binding universal stress UspA family protein